MQSYHQRMPWIIIIIIKRFYCTTQAENNEKKVNKDKSKGEVQSGTVFVQIFQELRVTQL